MTNEERDLLITELFADYEDMKIKLDENGNITWSQQKIQVHR